MFFQTPTPPTPPSGGGGLSDSQFERLQNSITRAVESGFKNAKFEKTSTTGTKSDDGYFGRRSYGGGDQSTQQEIEEDILSPGRMLKNAQSKILGPLYAAGKDLSLEMSRAINSLQQDATNVFVQFGKGREASAGISKSLGEAKFSIMEMGGGADDAFKTLTELYDTTNKTSLTSAQYVDDLYASAEVTGVRVGELAGKFETVGNSIRSVSSTMMDVVDYAASVGLNVQAVSKQVVQNFEKLNTYNFEGGVKGLTRMAAQATMLKMDMSRTLALADDLLSPEKAMEMAAGLQRLGVSTSALIDPLRLMDMAQNDPEQLQKEIVNLTKQYTYFNEETKKTEILPGAQRYLRELAPILGLSTQELANMAVQSGTIERKLSEIRMPNVVQTEEDKMLFANLAELNKEGKYEIKYYDENAQEQKVLLENMTETQRDAIKASQKIMDDPKEIAKRQLTAAEQTNMLLESLGARLPRELAETKTAYELSELTTTISRTTARGTYDAGRETLGISTEDLKGYDKDLIEFLDAAKTAIEEDSENIGNVIYGLEGNIKKFFSGIGEKTKDFVNESGEMDLNKMTEKIGNVFKNVGTEVAGNFSNSFKNAIDIELKGASSIFAESLLKGAKKVLDKFPEGSTSQGESTTNVGSPTPQETGSESDEFPDEPENITNTQTNVAPQDAIINNINNISLLEKDNVAIGRDGMMAGTDLMGLKERFGDMSLDLSKGFSSSIDEFKTSFRSLLENWSPTETLGQTQTGIEPKLLSDNLNITLNPELAPEFAKIYKEVRDMGKSIPLSFSFELPDFNFDFKTDKNMDSYKEFKKSLENQTIKPNIPTEDHKLKFTADKVEGLDQVNEKIGEVKSTKIEIPLEITDKSKDEPITRKVEASLDETNVSTMVKDLFSEKRMNIGFEFKNREEFEKLSNEFDELTKEKKINVTQEEFKSEIPTEQTLKVIPKSEEFKSNIPEEQTSHLKLQFNREETDSIFKEVDNKFKNPFKLKFEQEKFESTIPSEQTLNIKLKQDEFVSNVPEEQISHLKLDYNKENTNSLYNQISEKFGDPFKLKFEQEKFESNIPQSETIKIKTEQEEFESTIPKEQTSHIKFDYDKDKTNTLFDQVTEKFGTPLKLKYEQDTFEQIKESIDGLSKSTPSIKFTSSIDETPILNFNKEYSDKEYKLGFNIDDSKLKESIPTDQNVNLIPKTDLFKEKMSLFEGENKFNFRTGLIFDKEKFDDQIENVTSSPINQEVNVTPKTTQYDSFFKNIENNPYSLNIKFEPDKNLFHKETDDLLKKPLTTTLGLNFDNKGLDEKLIEYQNRTTDLSFSYKIDEKPLENTILKYEDFKFGIPATIKPQTDEIEQVTETLKTPIEKEVKYNTSITNTEETKNTIEKLSQDKEISLSTNDSSLIKSFDVYREFEKDLQKPIVTDYKLNLPEVEQQEIKYNTSITNTDETKDVIKELSQDKEISLSLNKSPLMNSLGEFKEEVKEPAEIKLFNDQDYENLFGELYFNAGKVKEEIESKPIKIPVNDEEIKKYQDGITVETKFTSTNNIEDETKKIEEPISKPVTFDAKVEEQKYLDLYEKYFGHKNSNVVFNTEIDFDKYKEKESLIGELSKERKVNFTTNFVNQDETQTLIGKMSSDKEFKLFADNESLIKANENVGSIFDKDFKVTPKLDETKLIDTKLPDLEQKVSFKQPSDDEMTKLKQQFENNVESFKLSYNPKPTELTAEKLNEDKTIPTIKPREETTFMSTIFGEQNLFGTKLVDLLTSSFNSPQSGNLMNTSIGVENESTSILRAQLSENLTTNTLLERMVVNTSKEVQPVNATPETIRREEIPNTNNLATSVTSNSKMEFGELKIVHQININSGNIDPTVVGQAFTQLTRDPSFVKTLENKIKDIQGGMGQQVQMNPLSA